MMSALNTGMSLLHILITADSILVRTSSMLVLVVMSTEQLFSFLETCIERKPALVIRDLDAMFSNTGADEPVSDSLDCLGRGRKHPVHILGGVVFAVV